MSNFIVPKRMKVLVAAEAVAEPVYTDQGVYYMVSIDGGPPFAVHERSIRSWERSNYYLTDADFDVQLNVLSRNIRLYRQRLNMSQSQLAERVGCRQESVSAWEMGRNAPHHARLRQVSEVLGVPISVLLGEEKP